jgi:hypothetical protein
MYFRWLGNKLELTRTGFLASRRDRKITARLVSEGVARAVSYASGTDT